MFLDTALRTEDKTLSDVSPLCSYIVRITRILHVSYRIVWLDYSLFVLARIPQSLSFEKRTSYLHDTHVQGTKHEERKTCEWQTKPACMCAQRYACILPLPCSACSCPVCRLLVLECSPAVHECTRSPVARCSMWLHPCLYVVKCLRASRRPNIHCSFSHTDVHLFSALVGIMRMLRSCFSCSCPL